MKNEMSALMSKVEDTAKAYGYSSKKEIAIFVIGWTSGYAYILADRNGLFIKKQHKKKRN